MTDHSTSLHHLLALLPEAVVQTDAQWVITYVNPAWERLTGHPIDATLGQLLPAFAHPDDEGTLRSGMPVFRLRLADGEHRWVRLQLQAHNDPDGRLLSRQGVLIEVDAATEQVLVEVRQRFLRLLETIDGVVWEAERGVGNTFLSPQVERLFGYTVEEWRADPQFWRAHVHPDDFPNAYAIDEAAYNATRSYPYEMSYRLFAKSGEIIWVRDLCRVIVEEGRPNRMIGLMIDVSRAKHTELRLLHSESRYELATRGSNDGIWEWNLETGAWHVSHRFLEILGLDDDCIDALGDGWPFLEPFVDPEDGKRVQAAYQRHLAGADASFSVDFRARQPSGRLAWVNWRGAAQFANGRPVRMAGSLTNLAERSSYYDALTNLPGRPLFRDRLEHAIALHRDDANAAFAVLVLDLNQFKAVNDTLGHHVGDQLLQQVARRLESCIRAADLVARMSGDEFNVLLEYVDLRTATARAEKIAAALAEPYTLGPHTVASGASIGVVGSDAGLATADDYLRAADAAMYRAKTGHLGVSVFAD